MRPLTRQIIATGESIGQLSGNREGKRKGYEDTDTLWIREVGCVQGKAVRHEKSRVAGLLTCHCRARVKIG